MSDVFISYARTTTALAQATAQALTALGYEVWLDDQLPAHRPYTDVIEERLRAAKAVLVIWSAEAVKSQWVRAEAELAREAGTLVQFRVDDVRLPMPFSQIHCADLAYWTGDQKARGWRNVVASIADLVKIDVAATAAITDPPLPLPGKPSIAVLPFANLSSDPEQDYFADGMVDEITTALSRIRTLFVIASGSSLSLRGDKAGPAEAGRKLGVRYVLEGSVRKSANRVRIAVKLVDASDGAQIWADRFDDTLEDLFALQDRVALAVAGVIEPAVQAAEVRRAASRPTDSMGGYDLFLRALPLQRANTRDATFEALKLLHRAVALDPDYGLALVVAALCHNQVFLFDWSDDGEDHHRQAREMAHQALIVAGDDPDVLARAAPVILRESPEDAAALVDRAITLNPGCSYAWYVSGLVRTVIGQADVAVESLEKSMRLDPLSPYRPAQLNWLGAARFEQRRFGDAAALFRVSARLRPANPTMLALLAACHGHLRQSAAGREVLAKYAELTPAPLSTQADRVFGDPDHHALCLEGITLTRESGPAAAGPVVAPRP